MQQLSFIDIYGYEYTPFYQTTKGIVFLSIIAIAGGALLIYGIYKWWQIYALSKNRRTPWEQALIELEIMQKQLPATKQEGKLFYFALTSLVKKYFNKRFGWKLDDKTDEECIAFLRSVKFDEPLCKDLERMFASIAEIKFADAQTLHEYVVRDLTLAQTVINKTIPADK